MPTAKRGKIDYLFQRPGSTNWWIKLRSPGKRIEKSLGTPDRAQAEIIALRDYIPDHKERLLAARPRIEPAWQHKLEPGREHAGPDNSRIVATDKVLIRVARLAEPMMPEGGCLLTVSHYGAEKVVDHYNIMGPVKSALEGDCALPRRRARPTRHSRQRPLPWPAQDASRIRDRPS